MKRAEIELDKIKCPKCGELIPVSETIHHQIAEKAREELKAASSQQQKAFAAKEKALNEKEEALSQTIQNRLKAERAQLEKAADKKARDALAVEIEDLKKDAADKERSLKASQKAELELRQQKRGLEQREKSLALDTARKIDAERKNIEEQTAQRVTAEHRLKDAEKDKKLQDAIAANEDLRRKLQQGSQQTQGEVLELQLEELLRATFSSDQIEPVPKGVSGADIIQTVFNRTGQACGTIVWESKHTKGWSDGWISKLKDDQRLIKADIAVIVTDTLPKDCKNFGQMNGVWVSDPTCAVNLAAALRLQLIEVAVTKLAAVGKNEKMEILYRYLSGTEFKQRVEAIVEAFGEMQSDLQEERRVTERRWSKREKQLQKVISNTAGMYGDFQGLIGSSLQSIPALTLEGSQAEPRDDKPTQIAGSVVKAASE